MNLWKLYTLLLALNSVGFGGSLVQTSFRGVAVNVHEIGRVDFLLDIDLIARRDLDVRKLKFADSSLDGVPVEVRTLFETLSLKTGRPVRLDRGLAATVYLDDASHLIGLRQLLGRRSVRFTATLEAEVDTPVVGWLRFARRTMVFTTPISLDVPVTTPERLAGLSLLAIERVLAYRRSFVNPGWADSPRLLGEYGVRVAHSRLYYRLRGKRGESQTGVELRMGMLRPDGSLCIPREAVQPWLYRSSLAYALQKLDFQVAEANWVIRSGDGRWTRQIDLTRTNLVRLRGWEKSVRRRKVVTLWDGHIRRIQLADREHPSNLLCVQVEGPAIPEVRSADLYDRATQPVVVLRQDARSGALAIVRRELMQNNRDAPLLNRPVDSATIGSPVISEDGLVGMLLTSESVVPIPGVQSGKGGGSALESRKR